MRLFNKLKINTEDYSDEFQEDITRLAETYNPFIDELETIINGNIDFENLKSKIFTLDVVVDANGTPIQGGKFNISNTQPYGFQIINAKNQTNSSTYPTSHPYMSFTPTGTGAIQINNITGLQANNKYKITVISY